MPGLLRRPRQIRLARVQLFGQFLLAKPVAYGRKVSGTSVQDVKDGRDGFRQRHAGRAITLRRLAFGWVLGRIEVVWHCAVSCCWKLPLMIALLLEALAGNPIPVSIEIVGIAGLVALKKRLGSRVGLEI